MPTLTIPELLHLAFGDEEYYHDRVWLSLYTNAIGHCRVIGKPLAEDLFTKDPNEQFVHIQVYDVAKMRDAVRIDNRVPESFTVSKVSPTIYTLWPILTWRESNERLRLSRDESNTRRMLRSTRDICEFIARDVAIKICGGRSNEQSKLLATGLVNQAFTYEWNVSAFLDYIDLVAKQANLESVIITENHRKEFICPPLQS